MKKWHEMTLFYATQAETFEVYQESLSELKNMLLGRVKATFSLQQARDDMASLVHTKDLLVEIRTDTKEDLYHAVTLWADFGKAISVWKDRVRTDFDNLVSSLSYRVEPVLSFPDGLKAAQPIDTRLVFEPCSELKEEFESSLSETIRTQIKKQDQALQCLLKKHMEDGIVPEVMKLCGDYTIKPIAFTDMAERLVEVWLEHWGPKTVLAIKELHGIEGKPAPRDYLVVSLISHIRRALKNRLEEIKSLTSERIDLCMKEKSGLLAKHEQKDLGVLTRVIINAVWDGFGAESPDSDSSAMLNKIFNLYTSLGSTFSKLLNDDQRDQFKKSFLTDAELESLRRHADSQILTILEKESEARGNAWERVGAGAWLGSVAGFAGVMVAGAAGVVGVVELAPAILLGTAIVGAFNGLVRRSD
eukprot:Protomagalhaensia_wolfi_Nauph_80__5504@NODE_603_length_2223_cov_167_227564_g427_i1_p1_GENE_NODE_603_length_2223_cov_167_227564_g427_i1NODE_603_length_2223_cov_167_227564_g427_i1_p1_ORF_typecomplete_len417_score80_25Elongin_A/PF06881_11/0_23Elongin_A/PF06881_11/1_3e04Phage_holin_3_6/PF07332_11/6_2e03Phage_holin_3_6/PF07332_11/0_048_NODE_603_length_2223_cov_167_227564_g427_i11981448